MIFDYDFTSVAAGMPVSGPLSQWYGPTASESAAAPGTMAARAAAYPVPRTPGIPAVVAGTGGTAPATRVLGAAAAPMPAAQYTYSSAQALPVRDASVWTVPLKPLPGGNAR